MVSYSNSETLVHQKILWVQILYLGILLFSTIFCGVLFQLFYFTLPLSSLCFPVLFLLAAILSEVFTLAKTFKFLALCSAINALVAMFTVEFFHLNLHDFWLGEWEQSRLIYSFLTIGFHLGLAAVLLISWWFKKRVGRLYSFVRASIAAVIANAIDLIIIWPILFANTHDSYLSSWKFLTLTIFKVNIFLITLPLAWFILWSTFKPIQNPEFTMHK